MREAILVLILLAMLIVCGKVYSYDNSGYPYSDTGCGAEVGPYDIYGFRQNNCTSYAAFVLSLYGVPFNNNYKSTGWHHGKDWNEAAVRAGISVSSDPLPGDIAYWDSVYAGDQYGRGGGGKGVLRCQRICDCYRYNAI